MCAKAWAWLQLHYVYGYIAGTVLCLLLLYCTEWRACLFVSMTLNPIRGSPVDLFPERLCSLAGDPSRVATPQKTACHCPALPYPALPYPTLPYLCSGVGKVGLTGLFNNGVCFECS
jgi:hypothetical protein